MRRREHKPGAIRLTRRSFLLRLGALLALLWAARGRAARAPYRGRILPIRWADVARPARWLG